MGCECGGGGAVQRNQLLGRVRVREGVWTVGGSGWRGRGWLCEGDCGVGEGVYGEFEKAEVGECVCREGLGGVTET